MKTTNIFSMAAITIMALFTSCSEPDYLGEENGHQYVDLSLPSGTMWASCNIGAKNPSDYGYYFAWAETCTKDKYGYSSYLYMDEEVNSESGYTKYTIPDGNYSAKWYDDNEQFVGDRKSQLEDADDAAVQAWGGKWKTPTSLQLSELKNECYWVWTSAYKETSVAGYIVYKAKSSSDKGKSSKNYTPVGNYDISYDANIFLPVAGYRSGYDLESVGYYGYLWSSTLSSDYTDFAEVLCFTSFGGIDKMIAERKIGFTVRPVCVNPGE